MGLSLMLFLVLCDPSVQTGNVFVALEETLPPVQVPGFVGLLGLTFFFAVDAEFVV